MILAQNWPTLKQQYPRDTAPLISKKSTVQKLLEVITWTLICAKCSKIWDCNCCTSHYHEILIHLFGGICQYALIGVPVWRETKKVFPQAHKIRAITALYYIVFTASVRDTLYLQVWSQVKLSGSFVNLKSIFSMIITMYIWWPMNKFTTQIIEILTPLQMPDSCYMYVDFC